MPRRRDLPEATLLLGPRGGLPPSGCVAERQTRDEACGSLRPNRGGLPSGAIDSAATAANAWRRRSSHGPRISMTRAPTDSSAARNRWCIAALSASGRSRHPVGHPRHVGGEQEIEVPDALDGRRHHPRRAPAVVVAAVNNGAEQVGVAHDDARAVSPCCLLGCQFPRELPSRNRLGVRRVERRLRCASTYSRAYSSDSGAANASGQRSRQR